MYKKIYFFLYFLFLITTNTLYPQEKNHLDFILIIEDGSGEYQNLKNGNIPAVFSSIIAGIEQKIFLVIHSGVFAMLLSAANSQQEKDIFEKLRALIKELKDKWEVKINKEGDWVILNPKNLKAGSSLFDLGFETKNLLDPWQQEPQLIADLENQKYKPINIKTLNALFDQNKSLSKRIFIDAHGTSALSKEPKIGGMTHEQYFEFLKAINPTADFLYLLTCYSGGFNSVAFHKQEIKETEKNFSGLSIRFPIVLGSSIESVTYLDKWNPPDYKKFFTLLDEYLKKPTAKNLKDALSIIYAKQIKDTGIPLIRFPGFQEYFRAVELDDTIKILNQVSMRAYALDPKNKKNGQIEPYEIKGSQMLLLYPAIVTIPISINNPSDPQIISMITGRAFHRIDLLTTAQEFQNFLEVFNNSDITVKAFFIKKLICADATFTNAVIVKVGETLRYLARVETSRKYPEYVGNYILLNINFSDFLRPNPFEEPNEAGLKKTNDISKAAEIAKKFLNQIKVNSEALSQASGGMETVKMIEDSIAESLALIK